MSQSTLSIAWNQYASNVCCELRTLQQNGELVDMTLAAEGHMVKVHQLIMSLISPYIKKLILSTNCPHPVIFLNKVSYTTLCFMLEFIYKGEVVVPTDKLSDLIQAGKELHIKCLEEMGPCETVKTQHTQQFTDEKTSDVGQNKVEYPIDEEIQRQVLTEIPQQPELLDNSLFYIDEDIMASNEMELESSEETIMLPTEQDSPERDDEDLDLCNDNDSIPEISIPESNCIGNSLLQYTVSNQGSLQLVLNKFIYYLRYTSKTESQHKVWRCVEYIKRKCPAYIICRDNAVIGRVAMHTHSNHERRIRKKFESGEIFDTVYVAEERSISKKKAADS